MAFSELFAQKARLEANRLDSYYFSVAEVKIGVSVKGLGFLGGSVVKNPNAGDAGLIPGSGRSPREGNGNPLQYTCLGNPKDEEPGGLQSMRSLRHDLVRLSD